MYKFLVRHRYCGMTRQIEGYDIWDALRRSGLNPKIWG